jgi:hypothetical protein
MGKLDFMEVISILSCVYDNSSEYGLKRQIMSSFCFTSDEALYGFKEDQANKKEQEEPITDNESEEEPVMDFNNARSIIVTTTQKEKSVKEY